MGSAGPIPSRNAPSGWSKIETSLGPGCRGSNGSPRYLEMLPKAGIEDSSYPCNQRISRPVPSPIQYLSGLHHCQISPELQERAEIHPCLLGLGVDAFFLVYRIPGVFRDGELDSLANHKWPPKESRNFRDGGATQFQEFGSPVNEGQHFNGSTLGPNPQKISWSGPPAGVLPDQSDGIVLLGTTSDSLPPSCISYHIPYRLLAWQPGSPLAEQTPG